MRSIRRVIVLGITAALVGTALAAATPAVGAVPTPPPGAAEEPLRVIVVLEEQKDAARVGESVDAGEVREMSELPIVVLEVAPESVADLEADPRVVSVFEDKPQPPNLASSLPVINGDDVHALGYTGDATTVAILDTGIDAQHPFYNTRIIAQFCSSSATGTTQQALCPDGTTTDTNADVRGVAACLDGTVNICDHGPHVAGIAAGGVAGDPAAPATVGNGVAPDADIIAMQVFTRFNDDADCGGNPGDAPCVLTYASDQIAALNELLAMNANNPGWNIVSANMSLGGGQHTTSCDGDARKTPIDALLAAGIVTVISAGNDGFLNAVGDPGCVSTAFTVGSTDNNDVPTATRNRGQLLDVFAPGDVMSSVPDSAYGFKGGTSMSAPHVTGAFAVLREAYPTRTIAELTTAITSTGVPITYPIDMNPTPTQHTTPRLDLLAALQAFNDPPTVTAGAPAVTVDEGQLAVLAGAWADTDSPPPTLTASSGTVVRNGDGTWSWSEQAIDGPSGSKQVTITATDDKGETDSASFQFDILNVAPTVTATGDAIDEGQSATVTATFTDPGVLDTHTATIDWGTGAPPQTVPIAELTTGVQHAYGDDGDFDVTVTVTDHDGGVGVDDVIVTVGNLDPAVDLDVSGQISFPGGDFFVVDAGEPLPLSAAGTDPGSDDLTFTWSTGDVATVFNDGVGPDPDPSPDGVFPFLATDDIDAGSADPAADVLSLELTDDDGGSDAIDAGVIVTGSAELARSNGWWKHQYSGNGTPHVDPATGEAYLDIVDAVSSVFAEETDASTPAAAHVVLSPTGAADARTRATADLLRAWLHFASGSVDYDAIVPLDSGDTAYLDLMFAAEELILDTTATRAELLEMERDLQRTMHAE